METIETLRYFENRLGSTLELIGQIVDIESPSLDFGQSAKVVGWFENELAKIPLALTVEKIAAQNCGTHLIVRAFPANEKPVLLLGHTDTVHPIGAKLNNPTRVENGKFYGGGIFDMKANVVLLLEILRFFAASGIKPSKPLTILLSCDEEVGSQTGREIVEREAGNAAFCLVFEPSANGKVKTGRKGTGLFHVAVRGVPAHAGLEPEKGANAIAELAKQIPHIHALNDSSKGTTANVCQISGGTASNVIAEHAECSVDVRFASMSEAENIENSLKNLESFDARVTLKISGAINRPPLERTKSVVELYEKAKNLAATFDYELGETQVGGASDGNFAAALGVPVLDGLGIAGDGAHTLHEHILIADIAKRAVLLVLLLS